MSRHLQLGWSPEYTSAGKVVAVVGTLVRATGLAVGCGDLCILRNSDGRMLQHAEVVGFSGEEVLLMPLGGTLGLSRATRVVSTGGPLAVRVGDALLGRVVDVLGNAIDGGGPIECVESRPVVSAPPEPMRRPMIDTPFFTGVRSVDAFATIGEGQRLGIFAPAGTGKSTLMSMFARGTEGDVIVIALIGERGREVREFVERVLGEEGMRRSVVVCATSDRPSVERAKAAHVGTAVAEYFRDRGCRVLLMMDSLTRYARALREIGLATGEPPARQGFPPSVFAELPRLVERPGRNEHGSITALYTVLADDAMSSDPISEEVRSLLDGHLVLSRELAEKNHFPAVDVLASLSRVMREIVTPDHMRAASDARRMLARYHEVEMLIRVGEYQRGSDPSTDLAIARQPALQEFLAQSVDEVVSPEETLAKLEEVAS